MPTNPAIAGVFLDVPCNINMARHQFQFMRFHTPDRRTPEELRRAEAFKRRLEEDAERQVARVALGHRVAKSLNQRGIIWQ